jgi:uncharacterized Zn finger protein
MSYYEWRPYVSVAEKQRQAKRKLDKLKKQGQSVAPVRIDGRAIAKSFWGKAWCVNLERYRDEENRLPRGRTYVRNGSVIDLQIAKGKIAAMVAGSELYKIKITIAPVAPSHWKSMCRDCAGTVDSLVELLQGRLAKGVMDRVCRETDGLFPSPEEIKLSCSCPDWAGMCKHVAAVLYGVGARLDENPQLLFVLRDVDENEMFASAGHDSLLTRPASGTAKLLDESDVEALFGLEMAEATDSLSPAAFISQRPQRSKAQKVSKKSSGKTKAVAKKQASHDARRAGPGPKKPASKPRTRSRSRHSA